jgi:predicted glycosyltransferase
MRRIAFHPYDERGRGHVRRSTAVAHALSAAVLLIAGAREAARFPLPEGTDTLALPAPSTAAGSVPA